MSQEVVRKLFEEMFEDKVGEIKKAKRKEEEKCDSDGEGGEGKE